MPLTGQSAIYDRGTVGRIPNQFTQVNTSYSGKYYFYFDQCLNIPKVIMHDHAMYLLSRNKIYCDVALSDDFIDNPVF